MICGRRCVLIGAMGGVEDLGSLICCWGKDGGKGGHVCMAWVFVWGAEVLGQALMVVWI